MYIRPHAWDNLPCERRHVVVVRTVAARHPDWTFCNESAAALYGLRVSADKLRRVHVVTTSSANIHSSRRVMRHLMDEKARVRIGGVAVTPLERTVFDCLRTSGFCEGVVVADSALRAGAARDDLIASMRSRRGFRGVQQALDAMGFADGRAESGGESIARARMHELGFAAPELQVDVVDPIDGRKRRVDFLWRLGDGSRVAGELDGHEKRVNPRMTRGRSIERVLEEERFRESHLTLVGIRFLRFSYADVCDSYRFSWLLEKAGIPRMDGRPSPLARRSGGKTRYGDV